MKLALVIYINNKSLLEAGMSQENILDKTMGALASMYNARNLDFEIGYNPSQITSGENS